MPLETFTGALSRGALLAITRLGGLARTGGGARQKWVSRPPRLVRFSRRGILTCIRRVEYHPTCRPVWT